jgi:hypothetical protein
MKLQQGMSQQKLEGYEIKEDDILMYRRRVCVPNDQDLNFFYCQRCIRFLM